MAGAYPRVRGLGGAWIRRSPLKKDPLHSDEHITWKGIAWSLARLLSFTNRGFSTSILVSRSVHATKLVRSSQRPDAQVLTIRGQRHSAGWKSQPSRHRWMLEANKDVNEVEPQEGPSLL